MKLVLKKIFPLIMTQPGDIKGPQWLHYLLLRSKNSSQYQKIQKAIIGFEHSLADGQHVEQSILENVWQIWHIDVSRLSSETKDSFSAQIDNLITVHCYR